MGQCRGGGVNALRGHSNVAGHHRPRPAPRPRRRAISCCRRDREDHLRRLHESRAASSPLRPRPDQLLAELRKVLRQPAEELLRRRRRPRTTTGPTTTCPSFDVSYDNAEDGRQCWRPGQMKRPGSARALKQSLLAAPKQGQGSRPASPSSNGLVVIDPPRDRDGALLGETTASSTTSTPNRSRPRVIQLPASAYAEEEGSGHQTPAA